MWAEIIHPPWWMWANRVKVMHHVWLAVGEHYSWSFPALWAANGAEHIPVGETNTMAPLWCQMCCQLCIVSSDKAHTPGSGARRAFKFGMRYSAVNVPAARSCPPTLSTTKLFSHSRLSWLFFPIFCKKTTTSASRWHNSPLLTDEVSLIWEIYNKWAEQSRQKMADVSIIIEKRRLWVIFQQTNRFV